RHAAGRRGRGGGRRSRVLHGTDPAAQGPAEHAAGRRPRRARRPLRTSGESAAVTETIADPGRSALLGTLAPLGADGSVRASLVATGGAVRGALPPRTTLLYAVKANGHPDVLAALATEVDGFEVASGGELALARIARAGVGTATQISFGGPAKTDAELDAAV